MYTFSVLNNQLKIKVMANEPNEQEEPSMEHHLMMSSFQRAGIMGLIAAIMSDSDETPLNTVKQKIAATFGRMIAMDIMVKDQIELEVLKLCKSFLEQEVAVEEAKEILK